MEDEYSYNLIQYTEDGQSSRIKKNDDDCKLKVKS